MSNGVRLLIRMAIGLAFCAALTWIAWKLGGRPWALISILVCAPTLAWLITRPLIEVVHEGFTWVAVQPLAKWEGNYYAFGNVQVRVFDDGALWFAAKDVITATAVKANADSLLAVYPTGCKVLEGLVCLEVPALERFLLAHPSPESGRFLLWARREVVGPWEKKNS